MALWNVEDLAFEIQPLAESLDRLVSETERALSESREHMARAQSTVEATTRTAFAQLSESIERSSASQRTLASTAKEAQESIKNTAQRAAERLESAIREARRVSHAFTLKTALLVILAGIGSSMATTGLLLWVSPPSVQLDPSTAKAVEFATYVNMKLDALPEQQRRAAYQLLQLTESKGP